MASSLASKPIPLLRVNMPPRERLMPALERVLYSGTVGEGDAVYEFERRLAARVEAPYASAFYSGTAGLHTALLVAGVSPGDEVVSTPITAEPTNMAILHAGGRTVWADIDPRNGNLDPVSVAARITKRTKAIMIVHHGGIPASLDALGQIAADHQIPVIEDAAHAFGARYQGRPVGSHSRFVLFSFQAVKQMTTVDGGMLTLQREEDAYQCRLLRWFGIDRDKTRVNVEAETVGFKYHMNNVAATIGLVSLETIGAAVATIKANGAWYGDALRDIPGLDLCEWEDVAEPSPIWYSILAERRDDLARKLNEAGIEASLLHRRNDHHPVFAESRVPLPGVDEWWRRALHIPCGWWVGDEDRERIASLIRGGW